MILTPLFVKNSIDNYNNKMNKDREQQAILVGKINAAANIIAKSGRRVGAASYINGEYIKDLCMPFTRELDPKTNTWRDYKPKEVKRIVSALDPYGEENWEN